MPLRTHDSFRASCFLFALLGITTAGSVAAQSAENESQANRQSSRKVDEIVVTAQKREESLSEVPISIAVMDGDEIQKDSIVSFEELDEKVPNFFVARSPGADAIFLRGLGSGSGSPTLEQSVVLFVDDIYAGNAKQFQTPWLDLQRVEVLRGPQGYLVGKNTSAGAVRFISNRPGSNFEGNASVEYDFERDGPTFRGVLSGPVTDDIGMRGAVMYRNVDGYIKNTLNGRDEPETEEFAGRLMTTYKSGNFDALLKLEATTLKNDGNNYVMTSQIAGRPLDRTKESGSSLGRDFDDIDTQNAMLQLNWEVGGHTLTSITGYSAYDSKYGVDADFFETDLAYSTFDEDFDQLSQEFRLLSPVGQVLEYIVGAYAHTADMDENRDTGALFAPPASTHRVFSQTNDSWSLYGSLAWNISEQWRIQGGLRYTHDKKDASYLRIGGPLAFTEKTGTVQQDFHDSLSEGETDPSIAIQWRPDDALMLYASYSEGHKAGGFQGAIPNATPGAFEIGPEKSESFEVGIKGIYERFSFEIALFDTSYDDLQVAASVPVDPTSTVFGFFTGNAAEATSRGAELSGTFWITDDLKLVGSLALLDAEYDSYPRGPCAQGQPVQDPATGSCSLTGVSLPFAPDYSGSLSINYERPLAGLWSMEANLTMTFRDDFRTDAPDDPYFIQKAYEKYDARIAFTHNDSLEIAAVMKNIGDKYTFGFGGSGTLASNPVFGLAPDARMFPLDLPRTLLLQVRYSF